MFRPNCKLISVLFAAMLSILFCTSAFAQAFTFDYLTYSDDGFAETVSEARGKGTAYVFFGRNEFKSSGQTSPNSRTSYQEIHIYGAPRIYYGSKLKVNIAFQTGLLFSRDAAGTTWGAPWLWTNIKLFQKIPMTFRLGFMAGTIGNLFWLEDNRIDIGLLSSTTIGAFSLDGTLSYRIRKKGEQKLVDFAGLYNQAGNDIHYKLEVTRKLSKAVSLAALAMGYHSGNKKLDGVLLPDSYSRKTTLGAFLQLQTQSYSFYELGIVWDIAGRYDKKGFAVVFSVTE